MVNWFGESWGAPVNFDCPKCETPEGDPCGRCELPIVEGDRGMVTDGAPSPVAFHKDCFLKMIVNHEHWAGLDLVPGPKDGFEPAYLADGLPVLRCNHCGWSYSPGTGSWYSPTIVWRKRVWPE